MDIDAFVDAYTETALWSSLNEGGTPLEVYNSRDDIAPEALVKFRDECAAFLALLEQEHVDISELEPGQVAHDFWLTRNGHGAGFWDRGLGELGDELTKWAESFGSADLYVGDNGLIYQF